MLSINVDCFKILWTKKNDKGLIIFGVGLIIASLFAFFCVKTCTHLDAQVYLPIDAIPKEKAQNAQFLAFAIFACWFFALLTTPLWAIISFWRRRQRPVFLAFLFLTVTPIIFLILIIADARTSRSKIFRAAFTGGTQRTESLIWAIEAYKSKQGQYPEKLAELVPHFIMRIPQTGLAGYPEFKYRRLPNDPARNYELLIETSTGPLNWDVFVYWPNGMTEAGNLYGGSGEPFGKWVYVHE